MTSIQKRVRNIISEQLKITPDLITPAATFIQDLGADSLAIVELILAMEEEFGISIPDERAEGIRTVGDAIMYIEERQDEIAV